MIRRPLVALALMAGPMMMAGADPLAVALLAAMSLSVLALGPRLRPGLWQPGAVSTRYVWPASPRWIDDLHSIDHDCPVVLSVIRR